MINEQDVITLCVAFQNTTKQPVQYQKVSDTEYQVIIMANPFQPEVFTIFEGSDGTVMWQKGQLLKYPPKDVECEVRNTPKENVA